jgi:hypothetical protein
MIVVIMAISSNICSPVESASKLRRSPSGSELSGERFSKRGKNFDMKGQKIGQKPEKPVATKD